MTTEYLRRFSDEALDCEECQNEGFTLNECGLIAGPGKLEGEPLATYHAYHVMLDGFADDTAGPYWRIGNVIGFVRESGFVDADVFDTDAEARKCWAILCDTYGIAK